MLNFKNQSTQRWVSTFFINKLKKNGGQIPWLAGIHHGIPYGIYGGKIEPIGGINQFFCYSALGEHPEWKYPFFASITNFRKLGLNMKKSKTPVPVLWTKYGIDNKYFIFNIADTEDCREKEELIARIQEARFVLRSHKNAQEKFEKLIQSYDLPTIRVDDDMEKQWNYDFSSDLVTVSKSDNLQLGLEKIMHGIILSAFHSKRGIPMQFQKIDMEYGWSADLIASFGATLLAVNCGYRKSFISKDNKTAELAMKFARFIEYDNRRVIPCICLGIKAAKYVMGILKEGQK